MESAMMDRAQEFLARKRVAVVGVSRSEKDFTRKVYQELRRRGYDALPVNPGLGEIEGRPCFARLQDIQPPPEWALLFTSPQQTEEVVRGCLAAGVRRVWMHRGVGKGAASPRALVFCAANDMQVVKDLCPFMVLPEGALPHRIHGFFRRRALARLSPDSAPGSTTGSPTA
jgi:uncharacterized protein